MLPKSHKTPRQPRGMTLVEIMFALAIIGMILTLSYAAALRAWRSAQGANQRTQAQYIAQNAIEKVKAYRDLNAPSATGQTQMTWSGAPRVGGAGAGSGGFLQEIERVRSGFNVEQCDNSVNTSPEYNICSWKVVGFSGQTVTALSDSTSYTVYIQTGAFYCESTIGDIFSFCGGDISATQSVALEARVEYRDANGVASNATATTILTQP